MAVVLSTTKNSERGTLPLALYASRLIGVAEAQFWGVVESTAASADWRLDDRNDVLKFWRDAVRDVEVRLGFHIWPRFVSAETVRLTHGSSIYLRFGHVRTLGLRSIESLQGGATIDYASKPGFGVVSPIPLSGTDVLEIDVVHPGTDVPIEPELVEINGGSVTVTIPQCRLVTLAAQNTSKVGVQTGTTASFETTVDVRRIYADTSQPGSIVYPATESRDEVAIAAVVRLLDPVTGRVAIVPADATQIPACLSVTDPPPYARINYWSGLDPDDYRVLPLVDAVRDLTHARMPYAPSRDRCKAAERLWEAARFVDEKRMASSPWGSAAGALDAWRRIAGERLVRML